MGATLLIMAAGMGSRYGGNKQVDGLGPHGEILMEYSVYDAIRAGFDKVVFVIKPGMKERCRFHLRRPYRQEGQGGLRIPGFFKRSFLLPDPEERTKPFGTVHAVLVARD